MRPTRQAAVNTTLSRNSRWQVESPYKLGSSHIERGQKGDLRFIYSPIDDREEGDKQGFCGVALTESRMINWQKVIYVQAILRRWTKHKHYSPSPHRTVRVDVDVKHAALTIPSSVVKGGITVSEQMPTKLSYGEITFTFPENEHYILS